MLRRPLLLVALVLTTTGFSGPRPRPALSPALESGLALRVHHRLRVEVSGPDRPATRAESHASLDLTVRPDRGGPTFLLTGARVDRLGPDALGPLLQGGGVELTFGADGRAGAADPQARRRLATLPAGVRTEAEAVLSRGWVDLVARWQRLGLHREGPAVFHTVENVPGLGPMPFDWTLEVETEVPCTLDALTPRCRRYVLRGLPEPEALERARGPGAGYLLEDTLVFEPVPFLPHSRVHRRVELSPRREGEVVVGFDRRVETRRYDVEVLGGRTQALRAGTE